MVRRAGDPRPDRARRALVPDDAGVTPPPQPVPPCTWALPPPDEADEDGVVGVGADLAPSTLVAAYRGGIFPWPHPGIPLPWFSPDPRTVLPLEGVHVSRSLRRTLRRSGWVTTVDAAFASVVRGCAEDRGEDGTWITPAIHRAFVRLHELGWAHSLEVWQDDRLVGGIYGVQVGAVFTGESMFHRVSDASKVALVDLAARFSAAGGQVLDVQLSTPHLRRMGAIEIARASFLALLAAMRDRDVRMWRGRRSVADLAVPSDGRVEPNG